MIVVNFTRVGNVYSDFEAETEAYELRDGDTVNFASSIFLYAVRCLVREGHLKDVAVHDDGKFLTVIDSDGRLEQWPRGFCNQFEEFIDRLI